MAQLDQQQPTSAMKSHPAASIAWPTRLSAEIWLHRHGWALPISATVLLSATALLLAQLLPAIDSVALLRTQLRSAQDRPIAPLAVEQVPPPDPGEPLRAVLEQAKTNPVQVRRIAEIGRMHGISLSRGQYTSSIQQPSGIEQTDLTFSFAAAYPQSRAFIEGLLAALPNASVDRVSFEREQVQGSSAQVTLRMTLWRWPAQSKSEATQ